MGGGTIIKNVREMLYLMKTFITTQDVGADNCLANFSEILSYNNKERMNLGGKREGGGQLRRMREMYQMKNFTTTQDVEMTIGLQISLILSYEEWSVGGGGTIKNDEGGVAPNITTQDVGADNWLANFSEILSYK